MDMTSIINSLARVEQEIPAAVGILELRRSPIEELQQRLRKLLGTASEACQKDLSRGECTTYDDRTVIRLPQGALAMVYHASGAVKLTTGLAPMEFLFDRMESKSALTEHTQQFVKSLQLQASLGQSETLAFERLWQIKACAADRSGKTTEPVLCRAIGAFRHHIDGIPVLGPASVAVKVAGGGLLDSVSTLVRSPTPELLEKAEVVHPERALRQIAQQLAARFGDVKREIRLESPNGLRFGYLSLPKRKSQRLLAPVYMAMIEAVHEQERQAFVVAVSATEKIHLPLDAPGLESPVGRTARPSIERMLG